MSPQQLTHPELGKQFPAQMETLGAASSAHSINQSTKTRQFRTVTLNVLSIWLVFSIKMVIS
jgi:hypothetical protein